MSIQAVSNSSIPPKNMTPKSVDKNTNGETTFKHAKEEQKAPTKVKIGAAIGTLTGVALAMLWTFKSKSKYIDGIKETKNLKDYWHNLTHIKYIDETPDKKATWELEKLISRLTLGSVGGGLVAGSVVDKRENRKAKFREAIIQVIGNIYTPLLCVDGGIRVFEKVADEKIIKALKLGEKTKGIPKAIISLGCLAGGLVVGNKVGNTINEKAFHVKDNRKIKLADLSPQIDDACVAVSLVAANSSIGEYVSRVIPAALMIAGYSTGIMQERPERLECKQKPEQSKVAS